MIAKLLTAGTEVYETEVTPKLLDIVMQTGCARLQTDALLQDIVYLLEAT